MKSSERPDPAPAFTRYGNRGKIRGRRAEEIEITDEDHVVIAGQRPRNIHRPARSLGQVDPLEVDLHVWAGGEHTSRRNRCSTRRAP